MGRSSSLFRIALWLACIGEVVSGPFAASRESAGGVIEVDRESWSSIVDGAPAAVVMFYSPVCPHCIRFAPDYAAVAERYGTANMIFTRCDGVEDEALADEHNVGAFPNFLLFKKGEKVAVFRGRPDAAALLDWVVGQVPAFSVAEFDDYINAEF